MQAREYLEGLKTAVEDALEAATGKTHEQHAFDLVVDEQELERAHDIIEDLNRRIDVEIENQRKGE